MAVPTLQQLQNAERDLQTLEAVGNDLGTTTTREGATIKTVRQVIADAQTTLTDATFQAQEWASKDATDGPVDYLLFSALAYAQGDLTASGQDAGGSAKDWAQSSAATDVDGSGGRSALAYAQGDLTAGGQDKGGSAKDWAQADEYTDIDGLGGKSAMAWALDSKFWFDQIASEYLGPQASDPTVDRNGEAVTEGDWYFNTTSNRVRVYDGASWADAVSGITATSTDTLENKTMDFGSNTFTGTVAQFDAAISDGSLRSSGIKNVIDDYSAAGDGERIFDGAYNGTTVTSASNPWVAGDVGKSICIKGGGDNTTVIVTTTIASFVSAGEVTITTTTGGTDATGDCEVSWGTDDTTEIQAALDAAEPVWVPRGIYIVTGELSWSDGSYLVGSGPLWKPRTTYHYDGTNATTLLFHGVAGDKTCVGRISQMAVGAQGSTFSGTDTDDLQYVNAENIHVDCNNLADIGWYLYRCGNSANIDNLTAERAVVTNHLHLGLFTAQFGHFGGYESQDAGAIVAIDVFGWGGAEYYCNAYEASFHLLNNGTDGDFVEGSTTSAGSAYFTGGLTPLLDHKGTGIYAGCSRGSHITIVSEINSGRAAVIDPAETGGSTMGATYYYIDYIEGNGAGYVVEDYTELSHGVIIQHGYIHPGNGIQVTDASGTSGTATLTSANAVTYGIGNGDTIWIEDGVAAGTPLTTTVNGAPVGNNITLSDNLTNTVSGARVQFKSSNFLAAQDIKIIARDLSSGVVTTDDGPDDKGSWLRLSNIQGFFDPSGAAPVAPLHINSNTDKFVVDGSSDSRIIYDNQSPGNVPLKAKSISLADNALTGTLAEFNTAISDANILQDVAASFTMTLAGESTAGTTGNTASANYHRVGQMLTVYFDGDYTSFNGTGNLKLTGLPESALTSSYFPIVDVRAEDSGATFDAIWGRTTAASTEITLWKKTIGSAIARLTDSDLDGSASNRNVRLSGTITYRADV